MKKFFGIAFALSLVANPLLGATINEIRVDQSGTDYDEYFELAGSPSESLNTLTYIVLGDSTAGVSGVIEAVVSLAGQSIPSDGFFLAAENTITIATGQVDLDMGTALNFENSDNVTHMLVDGFTGALNDDLDTDDDGVLDATPWTTLIDSVALIEEATEPPTGTEWGYGLVRVGPDGIYAPGHVFRDPDGIGPWMIGGFVAGASDTPGLDNNPSAVVDWTRY